MALSRLKGYRDERACGVKYLCFLAGEKLKA